MAEQCPYLEYRPLSDADDDSGGDLDDGGTDDGETDDGEADAAPRAYCTAADKFVQAMRADVCNDRYGLDHETDCGIYRDAEDLPVIPEEDDE